MIGMIWTWWHHDRDADADGEDDDGDGYDAHGVTWVPTSIHVPTNRVDSRSNETRQEMLTDTTDIRKSPCLRKMATTYYHFH